MSDKKDKKKRKKNKENTLDFEGAMSVQDASRYLVELGTRLANGCFSVSTAHDSIALVAAEPVEVELRATTSADEQGIRIELKWQPRVEAVQNVLRFSDVPEVVEPLAEEAAAQELQSEEEDEAFDAKPPRKKANGKKPSRRK